MAEVRLEAVNSNGYRSQGSRDGVICRVERLIMLTTGVEVQVIVLSTGAMDTGALIVPLTRDAAWSRRGPENAFRVRSNLSALSVLRSGLIKELPMAEN